MSVLLGTLTNLLIGDSFHLVNHTKASLPNAIDDFVFVQFLNAAIAVDPKSLGLAWFSRHVVDRSAVGLRLMLRQVQESLGIQRRGVDQE